MSHDDVPLVLCSRGPGIFRPSESVSAFLRVSGCLGGKLYHLV